MGQDGRTTDRKAIHEACLDYAEGFFAGDPERLRRALSPELVKRTLQDGTIEALSREDLIEAATAEDREMPSVSVTIHDVHDDVATATVVSAYVDYVQLARIDGEWRILNVLWTER
jgi:hypothetical protein